MCMMIHPCLSTHIPTKCRWEGGQVDGQILSYILIASLWSSQHNKNTFHTFIPIITLNCIIQCFPTSVVVHSFTMIHEPSTYSFFMLIVCMATTTSLHISLHTGLYLGRQFKWVGGQVVRQVVQQIYWHASCQRSPFILILHDQHRKKIEQAARSGILSS